MNRTILGVDAGGQSVKSVPLDYSSLEPLGDVVYLPVNSNGTAEEILSVFREIVLCGLDRIRSLGSIVESVAFSCPGPVDYYKGVSLMDHKWKSIKGINLKDDLRSHGLPSDVPVFFCHDAHSLILGEIARGEAGKYRCVGGFIIGTGLGFGIIRDGKMEADDRGTPKFAFFKRPFRDATIEDYVASRGVPRIFDELTGRVSNLDAKRIEELAARGDVEALEAYRTMGRALAFSAADLVSEYGIECLVFGGRISNAFRFFGPAFAAELSERCPKPPRSYPSSSSEVLSMQGAALYARRSEEGRRAS